MKFRLQCDCGNEAKAEVDESRVPAGIDPKAAALREAAKRGWRYAGGRIGKSVITVVCPRCRDPLTLEGDIDPKDAVPTEDPPISG